MKRLLGVGALEIVSRIEEVLPTCLALPSGQCPEAVEPTCNGRYKPTFATNIGGHRAEQRGRCLIGAVGSAKPLNCGIGPPARLKEKVDPAHLVLCGEVGMITATGATGIGENQNPLGPVHKISRLGDIGARRA